MAHRGPAPKANKVGHSANADWTEVPDKPFDGPSPDLPDLGDGRSWHKEVQEWYETARRMPHCILWRDSDWNYAIETAYLRNEYWDDFGHSGVRVTLAVEIRRRDDQLGTTSEARRKLRLRYVDPALLADDDDDQPGNGGQPGTVTDLTSRRKRLTA